MACRSFLLLVECTHSKPALFLTMRSRRSEPQSSSGTRMHAATFPSRMHAAVQQDGNRSGVASCFLNELYAGGQSEFGVNVGEVGLHSPW